MTLTTKTLISNRKQIWRHNSWWNLLGKLLMEWVTCLQNLWVEEKRDNKTNNSQNFIIIYLSKAYRLGRITFWYMSSLYTIMPERCEHIRNAIYFIIIYFLSFFTLGSAIVVHHCRLPYPRHKLFSFPLISFSIADFHLLLQRLSK